MSSVKYHANCYKDFTSQHKIDRLLPEIKETVINENSHIERPYKGITRSKINTFNWKLCIFCQTKSTDNKEDIHQLTLMPVSNFIKENAKFNLNLFIALSTAIDCITKETIYHLKCYIKFKRLVERTEKCKKILIMLYFMF